MILAPCPDHPQELLASGDVCSIFDAGRGGSVDKAVDPAALGDLGDDYLDRAGDGVLPRFASYGAIGAT